MQLQTMATYLNQSGELVLITECKDGRYVGVRKRSASLGPRSRRSLTDRAQYNQHGTVSSANRGGNLVRVSETPWV